MGIAKRIFRINKKDLAELFGLPEGVEILSVKDSSIENAYEFTLGSAGEVEVNGSKITIDNGDMNGLIRHLGLESLRRILDGESEEGELNFDTPVGIVHNTYINHTVDEKTVLAKTVIEEILKHLNNSKRKGMS